jgi:uncharacterized protein YfeS
MELYVMTRSALSYGGHTIFTLAGRFLEEGLGPHGTAVKQITLIVCFRGGRVLNPTLQDTYDRFHLEHLISLPKIIFLRKKGRIEISYETTFADATFLERYGLLDVDLFSKAAKEIAEKLHLMDPRIKKSDDFDFSGFHADIAARLLALPQTEDELRSLKKRREDLAKSRAAAMDPWEKLGIDWDDYHSAARTLLDDPFLWDEGNDNAPHGNDTGADLLHAFVEWNKRHPHDPAHLMARSLLRDRGINAIDYNAVDEASVRRMFSEDKIALSINDEAMIAVAFAAVKHRGCCDAETRELANKTIRREHTLLKIMASEWPNASEAADTLDYLAKYLSKMPEHPPELADPNC